ncbi:hypothetical protein K432DRAFT_308937, partial [Lepidopterella palustris CBS 459.81]
EGKVITTIFPIIRGNANIPNEGNLPFNKLNSVTDGVTVDATPDLCDEARLGTIGKSVRKDLNRIILVAKYSKAPILPNLFMEVKVPWGVEPNIE